VSLKIGVISEPTHVKTLMKKLRSAGYDAVELGGEARPIPPSIDLIVVRHVSCSHGAFSVGKQAERDGRRVIYDSSPAAVLAEATRLRRELAGGDRAREVGSAAEAAEENASREARRQDENMGNRVPSVLLQGIAEQVNDEGGSFASGIVRRGIMWTDAERAWYDEFQSKKEDFRFISDTRQWCRSVLGWLMFAWRLKGEDKWRLELLFVPAGCKDAYTRWIEFYQRAQRAGVEVTRIYKEEMTLDQATGSVLASCGVRKSEFQPGNGFPATVSVTRSDVLLPEMDAVALPTQPSVPPGTPSATTQVSTAPISKSEVEEVEVAVPVIEVAAPAAEVAPPAPAPRVAEPAPRDEFADFREAVMLLQTAMAELGIQEAVVSAEGVTFKRIVVMEGRLDIKST
jgi:hypothetical protein